MKKFFFILCMIITVFLILLTIHIAISKKEKLSFFVSSGFSIVSIGLTLLFSPIGTVLGISTTIANGDNTSILSTTQLVLVESTAAVATTKAPPTTGNPNASPAGAVLEPGKPYIYFNELEMNQINRMSFTAPVTGQYRFDFDISNVACDYRCMVIDSKGEKIGSRYYSSSEHGMTLPLTSGETYSMVVTQTNGSSKYTITLHVPKRPVRVES